MYDFFCYLVSLVVVSISFVRSTGITSTSTVSTDITEVTTTFEEDVSLLYESMFHSEGGGTYNRLTYQSGFCKMQGYDTTNRATSLGPSIYTSGKVLFGVGLSSYYFGNIPNEEGLLTCGMCLNITKIERMPEFSMDLTVFEPEKEISTVPFLAMVFDQCNDPICQQEGFLDFDIYSEIPSKNIKMMEWNAVACPVDEKDTIELLFCTKDTCNVQNVFSNQVPFGSIINQYFVSIIPRNMRIPIQMIQVKNNEKWTDLIYISAIGWTWPFLFDKDKNIHLRIESYLGNVLEVEIPIEKIKATPISLAYRGGIIYDTFLNF